MSVLDIVQQNLGPTEIQQLSQQIGADPGQTQTAIQAAVPMLLGGMASSAQQPGGAQNVAGAMQDHAGLLGGLGGLGGALGGALGGGGGGGGALGGLGAILAGAAAGGGGGLLGKVLGHQEPAVENGVQQASGLDSGQTRKLLMLLAPIVLAALARRRQQTQPSGVPGDANGDGIPDALQQEARHAQEQTQRRLSAHRWARRQDPRRGDVPLSRGRRGAHRAPAAPG